MNIYGWLLVAIGCFWLGGRALERYHEKKFEAELAEDARKDRLRRLGNAATKSVVITAEELNE